MSNECQGEEKRQREELVFHFSHSQNDDEPQSVILLGNFKLRKLYEDHRVILFDLSTDLSVRNDLATSRQDVAGKLRQRLEKYLVDVDAQFPTTNSNYDPIQTPAPAREKQGGKNGAKQKKGV